MAVENKYVDANIVAGKKATSGFITGAKMTTAIAIVEVAVADDDDSVYRLFKSINPDLIPVRITIFNDVITVGTDYDLGLYETTGEDGVAGVVIDQDILAAAMDMEVIGTRAAPKDGLVTVPIENAQKTLWELAGHTQESKKPGYDIALTAPTVGSSAGTIVVIGEFMQG